MITKARRRAHGRMHGALMAAVEAESGRQQDWTGVAFAWDDWKERVTVRLDASVLAWFRALGPGYQTRINQVLVAFVHARMAGPVETPAAPSARAEAAREDREFWTELNEAKAEHMRGFWDRVDKQKAEAESARDSGGPVGRWGDGGAG
jgi:uncharacterized protein (DUF4415 family)